MKTNEPQETIETLGEAAARLLRRLSERAKRPAEENSAEIHQSGAVVREPEKADGEMALGGKGYRSPSAAAMAEGSAHGVTATSLGGKLERLVCASNDNASRVDAVGFPSVDRDVRMHRPATNAGLYSDAFTMPVIESNVRWDEG